MAAPLNPSLSSDKHLYVAIAYLGIDSLVRPMELAMRAFHWQ